MRQLIERVEPLRWAAPLRGVIDFRAWVLVGLAITCAGVVLKEHGLPQPVLLAIGAVAATGLAWWSWRSPELAFYALVAYLPFSHAIVGDVMTGVNLTNLLVAWSLVTAVIARRAQTGLTWTWTRVDVAVLLFMALCVFALARAAWAYGAWYAWEYAAPLKRLLTPLGFYLLARLLVRDQKTLNTAVFLVMVATGIIGLISTWDYLTRGGDSFDAARVSAIAREPNVLAGFFVSCLFLYPAYVLSSTAQPRRWLLLAPLLLCLRGVMVTFSRGGYLAFTAGGLLLAWFRSKLLFLGAAALLAFAVTHPSVLPAGIRYRFEMTVRDRAPLAASSDVKQLAGHLEPSAAKRVELWQGAVSIIRDYPWWGVGYGGFIRYIPHYTQGRSGYFDVHNLFLLLASEMGIPTMLVFVALLGLIGYEAARLNRRATDASMKALALGVLGGVGGFAVANAFTPYLDAQESASYFWILSALMMNAALLQSQAASQGARSAP